MKNIANALFTSLAVIAVACDLPTPGQGSSSDSTISARGLRLENGTTESGFGIQSIVEEGVELRVRWTLPIAPDSQRFVVYDSLDPDEQYRNVKVNRNHRTSTANVPAMPVGRLIVACVQAWKNQAVLLPNSTGCAAYAIGQGGVIEVPTDTLPPVSTVDTSYRIPPVNAFAAMPQQYVDTRYPTLTGRSIRVASDGNLQDAINSANCGDEVVLPAQTVYKGNFYLPKDCTGNPVVIRTDTPLPPEGVRVTPVTGEKFAKVQTNNSTTAFRMSAKAADYRLVGLIIESVPPATLTYMIVQAGPTVGSPDSLSGKLVIDRSIVRGHKTLNVQRCVALAGKNQAVIDSWLDECHYKGQDAQAVFGYAGPGPYKLVNNYLYGSGENVMFGGADPKIPNLRPCDIEIRRNWIHKPLAHQDSAGYNPWTEKNLFELKNACRVLVEENLFENTWADGQNTAIALKSVNQSGYCDWCQTSDVTWRHNHIINAPVGFNLTANQRGQPRKGDSLGRYGLDMARIHIAHTALDSVDQLTQKNHQWAFLVGKNINGLVIERTTSDPQRAILYLSGTKADSNRFIVDFINNVSRQGVDGLGILGDSKAGVGALTYYCPTCKFTGNAIRNGTASKFPADNVMLTGTTDPPANTGVDRADLLRRLQGVREGTPRP